MGCKDDLDGTVLEPNGGLDALMSCTEDVRFEIMLCGDKERVMCCTAVRRARVVRCVHCIGCLKRPQTATSS